MKENILGIFSLADSCFRGAFRLRLELAADPEVNGARCMRWILRFRGFARLFSLFARIRFQRRFFLTCFFKGVLSCGCVQWPVKKRAMAKHRHDPLIVASFVHWLAGECKGHDGGGGGHGRATWAVLSTRYSVLRASEVGVQLDQGNVKTWRPDTDWAAGRAKAPVPTLGRPLHWAVPTFPSLHALNSLRLPWCGWGLQRSFAAVVLCAKRAKNNLHSG